MKKISFFALLTIALVPQAQSHALKPTADTTKRTKTIGAQNIKINEPEFDGIILYVNDTIGDGVRLEKQLAAIKTSTAIIKATSKAYVKNCCSNVRITEQSNVRFIVPLMPGQDPEEYIKITKLTSEKDRRVLLVVTANAFGAAKTQDVETINFDYKKYGQKSYLITIAKLDPGEYAIRLHLVTSNILNSAGSSVNGQYYLFGVQ